MGLCSTVSCTLGAGWRMTRLHLLGLVRDLEGRIDGIAGPYRIVFSEEVHGRPEVTLRDVVISRPASLAEDVALMNFLSDPEGILR